MRENNQRIHHGYGSLGPWVGVPMSHREVRVSHFL
jgi:hypothetical protein